MRRRTSSADVGSHPVSTAGIAGALDQDVHSLTNSQSDEVGTVGNHWNKVVGDDGQVVVVNGEIDNAFGARVNDSQKMSLSGLEIELGEASERRAVMRFRIKRQQAAVVVHLAVDQSVVGFDDLLVSTNVLLHKAVVILMIPVADHDGADINIVIGA